MTAPVTYRGTITREQWLVDETRVIARLMMEEGLTSDAELIERVTSQNLFQYPPSANRPLSRAPAPGVCAPSRTTRKPANAPSTSWRTARPTNSTKQTSTP